MFADISGFTTIVEEMSLLGSEGIERMTASLNAFFGILVETVEQHGGDVIKFAGDALFCQVIENRNNFNWLFFGFFFFFFCYYYHYYLVAMHSWRTFTIDIGE